MIDHRADRAGTALWPEDDEATHRVSAVSETDETERERAESSDSGADNPVKGGFEGTNPGFKAGRSVARDHSKREQRRAAVATPQRGLDERGPRGGPR